MGSPPIVNLAELPETGSVEGHYGGYDKVLTPSMRERGGKLGVVRVRLPPGTVACPFHHHSLEDEVFFVLSGRGVVRYGSEVHPLREGDCVSCPAGTGVAHQVANTSETEDLIYLAIGAHEPNEVCGYPDSGKVMVRSLRAVGVLQPTDYMAGEPELPKVFGMVEKADPRS